MLACVTLICRLPYPFFLSPASDAPTPQKVRPAAPAIPHLKILPVFLPGWEKALPGFDGLVRLRSTHVGGFVLSAQPLGHYLPVEQTTMGRTIVQFDKDDLDMIGVPKFDFLGLGALAMVRIAFDVLEAHTGKRPNMYDFEDRDEKTYDLIQKG